MPDQLAMTSRKLFLTAIISALPIFIIYIRVIHFDFVWDDTTVLFGSGLSHESGSALDVALSNLPISENYFRPFVRAAFAFDMWLFGDKPGPMHLHNLFVHICSSLLVGCLVVQFLRKFVMLDSVFFPISAALVFGLHPMLMEPAAWISGRFDAYVTFWLLLLLNLDLWLLRCRARVVSAYFCFLLAAMSKEMAITFPVLYVLIRMMYLKEQGSFVFRCKALIADGSVVVVIAIVFGGLTYLALRFVALGYLQQPFDAELVSAHFGSFLQHVLLVGKTAGTYLLYSIAGGVFTSPVHYQAFPVSIDDLYAWLGLLVVVPLSLVSLVLFLRGNRWGYVLPVFLIGLLPVLNIVFWPNTEDMVQERFMSLPLALVIALSFVLLAIWDIPRKMTVMFLVSAFLLVNAGITAASVSIWRDHMSLWTWAVHRAPLSPYANANLAVSCRLAGNRECAVHYAEKANELDPAGSLGSYTLAASAADAKQYEKAVEIADRYLANEAAAGLAGEMRYLKATALRQLGRRDAAASELEANLRADVTDYRSAMLLGNILSEINDTERASACWVLALQYMRVAEAAGMFSDGKVHIEEIQEKAKGKACFK